MLRPLTEGDVADVHDAWLAASRQAHPFFSEAFLVEEWEAIVSWGLPLAETEVYEVDGRVVGFLSMIDDEVAGLFVHPAFQGRGIGRALMDSARSNHRSLELTVFERNSVGRRFYDRYGFRVVERGTHETTGQPELRMRLD